MDRNNEGPGRAGHRQPVPAGDGLAAAAVAGVPLEAVDRITDDFRARLELDRAGGSLNDARAALARIAKTAAALRRAAYLPPTVAVLGGIEAEWPAVAAQAAETAAVLHRVATDGRRELEARAASYSRGGRRSLAHLIAESPKQRLVRDMAELLRAHGVPATMSANGPLHNLARAVHDRVTGEGERVAKPIFVRVA